MIVIRSPGSDILTLIEEEALPQRIEELPVGSYEIGRASISWYAEPLTISVAAAAPYIVTPMSLSDEDPQLGNTFDVHLGEVGGTAPLAVEITVTDAAGPLPGDRVTDIDEQTLRIRPRQLGSVTVTQTVTGAAEPPSVQTVMATVIAGRPAVWPTAAWSVAPGAEPGSLQITITALPEANGAPITEIWYRIGENDENIHLLEIDADGVGPGTYIATLGVVPGNANAVQLGALNAVGRATSWGSARVAEASASGYYPDVPPVDLAAAAGSLKLPEGNWLAGAGRAGQLNNKGMLNQSRMGFSRPASGTPFAIALTVRLPVEKRSGGKLWGIFGSSLTGSNRCALALGQPAQGTYSRKFRFIRDGIAELVSPVWTQDTCLIVAWYDGVSAAGLDWYSLADGERFAGTPVATSTFSAGGGSSGFGIGRNEGLSTFATDVVSGNSPQLFPGEIGEIWNIVGVHVTPEQWAEVALGQRIQAIVPPANVNYAREPGAAGILAKPAWATADTTPDCTLPTDTSPSAGGVLIQSGSTLRRQGLEDYVTLDEHAAGYVYGLLPGQTERGVTFSGRASGAVEIRVYDARDGAVVVDWTRIATPTGGNWSGTLTLPESARGYVYADVRLADNPTVIWHGRSEFGVGFKYMIIGQSQMQIPMDLTTTRLTIAEGAAMSGSVARLQKNAARPAALAREPLMGRIGAGNQAGGDGFVAFLNQFRKLKPATPVMIYHEAVGGTSFAGLISGSVDAGTDRQWADLQDKLDRWGNDVTAVLFNWLISETSPVTEYLEDAFLPAHAGHKANSLATALAPGWSLVSMPSDRRSDGQWDRSGRRAARTEFVQRHGFILGPNVCDYRIEDAGGGHPADSFTTGAKSYCPPEVFDQGGARMMQRTAVGALEAIGMVDQAAVLPHFANARLSPDATQIWVDVIAVNGGTIYSPNPAALRSWYLWEPGDTGVTPYSTSAQPGIPTSAKGYAAVLNTTVTPPRVEITRTSGTFAPGTYVYRVDDGEKRPEGSVYGYMEDEIHAGGIYESWEGDIFGFGFPVVGTKDAEGKWRNRFEVTV